MGIAFLHVVIHGIKHLFWLPLVARMNQRCHQCQAQPNPRSGNPVHAMVVGMQTAHNHVITVNKLWAFPCGQWLHPNASRTKDKVHQDNLDQFQWSVPSQKAWTRDRSKKKFFWHNEPNQSQAFCTLSLASSMGSACPPRN